MKCSLMSSELLLSHNNVKTTLSVLCVSKVMLAIKTTTPNLSRIIWYKFLLSHSMVQCGPWSGDQDGLSYRLMWGPWDLFMSLLFHLLRYLCPPLGSLCLAEAEERVCAWRSVQVWARLGSGKHHSFTLLPLNCQRAWETPSSWVARTNMRQV